MTLVKCQHGHQLMARVRAQGHSDSYKKLGSYVGKIWNPSDGKEQPKPSLQSCAHMYHEMNNKNHSNYSYFKKCLISTRGSHTNMQSCHISKACDKCVVSYVNSAKRGMMLTQLQMFHQLVGDDCLHYLPSVYHRRGENSPSHPCTTLLGIYLVWLVSSPPSVQRHLWFTPCSIQTDYSFCLSMIIKVLEGLKGSGGFP